MPGFNRRQLFRFRLGDLSREIGRTLRDPEQDEEAVPFVRPPGALPEEEAFLSSCERCHACAEACPYTVIRQFGPAFGPMEGTPFLDPATTPCHWCEDMPCIKACPSGALHQKEDIPVPPIAKVALNLNQCLNTQGILCDTCSFRCPSHIKAIRMVQRMPVLDEERCTGCGLCITHCEADSSAFSLVFVDPELDE
jgi:ferredoxin-type protein NapG